MSSIDRHASTAVPIHPLLASRHSTRAFQRDVSLTEQQTTALLEAARWSPSCSNTQPWRFLLAHRDTPDFKRVLDCLDPGNAAWAQHASALMIAVRAKTNAKGDMPWGAYDLGQSVAHLTFQAAAEGLTLRQMAGFDPEAVSSEFQLDDNLAPTAAIAIGVPGDPNQLDEAVRGPDFSPRERLAIEDIILN
ncbi:nitroreductase family protein [Natronoglycomyces albus]|uniref:Nitroreductase family protein n=1 Tax=Natronoglycomyces albus TaxID=2811108 RepID=A0A895XM29_9ACTN|nr:nitroreductase family protein [Natronoglycomyces albus]QSB04832.1 nitroreductase family protein [Natronoglycomyces albus]